MSGMNLTQVYAANPVTTVGNTDLIYLDVSSTTDAAITGANFKAAMSPLTTKGDLFTYSTTNARLAVGATNGQILQVSSGAATGLAWSTPTYPSASGTAGKILRSDGTNNVYTTSTFADTYAVSTLLYASSSNTVSGLATTNRASLSTNSTGFPSWLALTDGQIVIGSTAGSPAPASLSAGAGISVTLGSNTITIAATTGTTNVNQNTSSATLAAGSRYATNNGASLVTYTIPAGAAVGDTYIVVGGSSGGWTIAQPASVTCHIGTSTTTTGVGGSIASSNQYDCCTVTCVASNVFTVYGIQGELTIV